MKIEETMSTQQLEKEGVDLQCLKNNVLTILEEYLNKHNQTPDDYDALVLKSIMALAK